MELSKYFKLLKIKSIRSNVLLAFLMGILFVSNTFAVPPALTFQGRIINVNGQPLEYANVSFLFQITNPSGSCVIYQEQVTGYNMVNSGGMYDVPIGAGTIQFPLGAVSVLSVFSNSDSFSCGSCSLSGATYSCTAGSGTYTPGIGDGRRLRVSFYDGAGWSTVTPDNIIRSVPYAGYALAADKLGNNVASDFLLKAGLPTCGANTFLSWNGTSLSCSGVSGAAGGTVTNVSSANSYLTITNATTTPTLTLNVGNSANTVAAGDDSRIANALQASTFNGYIATGSCAANESLYWSTTNTRFECRSITFPGSITALTGDVSASGTGSVTTTVNSVGTSSAANIHSAELAANAATSANTASTIVKRDGAGGFSAGAVSGSGLVLRDSSSATVTLQAPSTVSGSYVLRLPAAQGSANQILSNDGSGNLSWIGLPAMGVSSVAVTAPISNSGTASAPNIGIAQATTSTAGYLSAADWNTFNGKLNGSLTSANIWVGNGSNAATAVAPSGDVTMSNVGAFTVAKLNGVNVSSTAPSASQFLKFISSAWTPATLGVADIKSTITPFNGVFASAACTSSQTLYYASGTDDFRCQSISFPGAVTALTGDVSATGTGSVTATVNSVGTSTAANIHSAELAANAATSSNTASTIVKRDASGGFSSGAVSVSSLVLRDSASATVSIQAPSTVSGTYVLRLPAAQGSANQILSNDGSGNLSWIGLPATGVSSVAVTAPISNSGTASAPNIGIAQATTSTAGYLSAADWNTFNGKMTTSLTSANIWVGNGSNTAAAVAPSGDVTMSNAGAFTVAKLNGVNISSTTPVAGQFLKYVSSSWTPTGLGVADIKSTITPFNGAFASAACTASQSLYYASGTDDFRCQTVAAAAGSLTGTVPVANLPTATTTGVYVNGGNSFGAAGKIGTKDSNSLTLVTGNSDRVTIDTSGKVGIGVTSPTSFLHVNGTLTDTTGTPMINFFYGIADPSSASTATYSGANGSIAKFDNPYMSGATIIGFSGVAEQGGTGTVGTATAIEAFVSKYGLGNITNVNGVYSHFNGSNTGTTTSFAGLRVGTALSSGALTNAYGVYIENLNGTNKYGVYQTGTGDTNYFAGNVGIGTSSPGYKLHVVGTAGLSTGTAWTNASDIRLKDIRGDYEYGLNEVLQLHTVRYNYKKDNPLQLPSDFEKTGFIAQEVQKVIPDAVNERSDGFLELNVDPIHWAVVNAIKEFYNKWFTDSRNLHAEIAELKSENAKIRERLERLENSSNRSQK